MFEASGVRTGAFSLPQAASSISARALAQRLRPARRSAVDDFVCLPSPLALRTGSIVRQG